MPSSQQNPRLSAQAPCNLAFKILNRIPVEYRHSLTAEQISALQSTLVKKRQKSSLTVTLGSFCLPLTAGRNQRVHSRQINQSMLAPVLCIMVSMVGMGCVMGLMKLRYGYQINHINASLYPQEEAVHPTTLPFRKDQNNCEKNGGLWTQEECIDHTHDPTF